MKKYTIALFEKHTKSRFFKDESIIFETIFFDNLEEACMALSEFKKNNDRFKAVICEYSIDSLDAELTKSYKRIIR